MGKGFDKILPKAEELKEEYFTVFLPELLGGSGRSGDDEDGEMESRPQAQSMPTGPVGPDQQVLATSTV